MTDRFELESRYQIKGGKDANDKSGRNSGI
jgi:hypothetical protein